MTYFAVNVVFVGCHACEILLRVKMPSRRTNEEVG